ncbi:PREDICTED: DNA ligase 1-like isoform X2 [Ipomoea nil]|uniref:DNA ligase 1-like isoform X2 n=1 Tax=Ipomoea nil TaxID=35883 RepID=UPI000901FC45|nr:PREDICTED: DNA ligase 1-like isoform X2 [Ipomoea nil]
MSRCFPYPPPGYTVRRSNEEAALIESIKLQKEREKAKAERKEEKKREKREKREKKERKKERKEKEQQNLSDSAQRDKSHKKGDSAQRDKSHKKDNSEFKDGCIDKKRPSESEQLERSNLTVEYGQAVCSQNPNTSSDSTQNSNKRKRHLSPPNVTRSHGNVIRIRLPSQKQMDYDSSAQNQQICSTSGRLDLPVQRKCETASSAGADNICSTSQQAQNAVETHVSAASRPKRVEKPMHKDELQFRNLIENWVPSSLNDLGDDDQDWLFKRRKHDDTNAKKAIASTAMLCGSAALWPRAQYLQDADIFALPYTIPF